MRTPHNTQPRAAQTSPARTLADRAISWHQSRHPLDEVLEVRHLTATSAVLTTTSGWGRVYTD